MNENFHEAVPFVISLNEWITGSILWCFLSITYVLSIGKYALLQSFHDFFSTRERNSLFGEQTMNEIHCKLLLIIQTCLLSSILLINYNVQLHPYAFNDNIIPALLANYLFAMLLFYFVKWIIYKFVNWIFFDRTKSNLWSESYFFILSMLGFIFFPLTLFTIYFQLSLDLIHIIILCIFIFSNLLLFYKCFCIFFNRLHGVFFLFVYFCTLEILPFFVLSRGLVFINELFI